MHWIREDRESPPPTGMQMGRWSEAVLAGRVFSRGAPAAGPIVAIEIARKSVESKRPSELINCERYLNHRFSGFGGYAGVGLFGRANRLAVQFIDEVEQHLGHIAAGLESVGARGEREHLRLRFELKNADLYVFWFR
jgi:hypothetical protein